MNEGIQLQYDSREDRVLLKSNMDIALPDWWITRRAFLALLRELGHIHEAQEQVQQLMNQLTEESKATANAGSGSPSEGAGSNEGDNESPKSSPKVTRSPLVEHVQQYPLMVRHMVELDDHGNTQVFLLNGQNQGICLNFPPEGLERFKGMLIQLVEKVDW